MEFVNPYWDVKAKLDLLARWIIVHSIIYYELDKNIVTDKMFDNNCRQYVTMVKENKREFKETLWYYVMYDFDGSTGFHLYKRLNKKDKRKLMRIADMLTYKGRTQNVKVIKSKN